MHRGTAVRAVRRPNDTRVGPAQHGFVRGRARASLSVVAVVGRREPPRFLSSLALLFFESVVEAALELTVVLRGDAAVVVFASTLRSASVNSRLRLTLM